MSKTKTAWTQCQTCFAHVLHKDEEAHTKINCPPNLDKFNFIQNEILYGTFDVKSIEDGIKVEDKDSLVFLSESAIHLCGLAIGDWAQIEFQSKKLAKIVWPTNEKSLTSVLFTKNGQELEGIELNSNVKVSKLNKNECPDAKIVNLIILNGPKTLELSQELNNRFQKTFLNYYFCETNKISLRYFGKLLKFQIKTIECDLIQQFDELSLKNTEQKLFKITNQTTFRLFSDETNFTSQTSTKSSRINQVGGLAEEIEEIRHLIKLNFNNLTNFGLKSTKSILLYGHSGTGKTLLAQAIAEESKANLFQLNSSDLYSKNASNIEETIKNVFCDAIEHKPSILLLDEVDILCPVRSQRLSETDKRIISILMKMFDQISNEKQIFIIGTTNKIDNIDASFRRSGRFEREIEIPTPNPKNRLDILMKLMENVEHNLSSEDLQELAMNTHGFVGTDLLQLLNQAALNASKRASVCIQLADLSLALKRVRPSAMREVQIEVANVHWDDIGGQEKLKLILRQAVEWPLKHAESFLRLGVTPPKGVLMFGPPGCSKTMIAKALATESGLNFLSIKGPELFSKWVGDSEKAVRDVFRKARQVAPSIIFFDEIDALGGERTGGGGAATVQERVLAQLLTELDGVEALGQVTVLAATNRPDKIDRALIRPGRLDRIVYVPLPDEKTRCEIFRIKLAKMPVASDVEIGKLVKETERYSGAEIQAVCHEAAMMALEESLDADKVMKKHFDKALELITPRTPDSLIQLYENYVKNSNK